MQDVSEEGGTDRNLFPSGDEHRERNLFSESRKAQKLAFKNKKNDSKKKAEKSPGKGNLKKQWGNEFGTADGKANAHIMFGSDDEEEDEDKKTKKKEGKKSKKKEGKKSKKKKDGNSSSHIIFGSDDEEKEILEAPVRLEPLRYVNSSTGIVTLGRISDITKYDLTVSLPFMTRGVVPITQISEAYTSLLRKVAESQDDVEEETFALQSLFRKGQYVVTKIDSIKKEKVVKVDLSILPKDVNFGVATDKLKNGLLIQCAVASVEDNGYAMETGISGVKVAFLNRTKADGAGIVGVGSIVQCVIIEVKACDDGRNVMLKLTAIPEEVNKASIDVNDTDDLSLLLPGTCFNTKITSVEAEYLKLDLAVSEGVVSQHHLTTPLQTVDKFHKDQKVTARVLYITNMSRRVHLTLQNISFNASPPEDLFLGFSIGDKSTGEVLFTKKKGIFFKLGNYRAYCPRDHISEKHSDTKDLESLYPVGSTQTFRITALNYFDEMFSASIRKSVMQEQVLSIKGVKIGQVLDAKIIKYDNQGALVQIATGVQGEIPLMHLTDTAVKFPEKKHPVGKTVKVRVLEIKPERNFVVLTCKKVLIQSKEPIVSEFSKDLVNTVTRGFIVKILPSGLVVAFYNGTKGFVPKSMVRSMVMENLEKDFPVGKVVKCKILEVNPEEQKMTLSLDIDKVKKVKPKTAKKETKEGKEQSSCTTNLFVDCVVSEVSKKEVKVTIKPFTKQSVIPVHHLADNLSTCKEILKYLSPGDELFSLLKIVEPVRVCLTMKESICNWVRKSDPKVQQTQLTKFNSYPAFVSRISPEGNIMVYVPQGEQNSRILPVKGVQNAEADKGYSVGESVQVKCTDFEKGKPVLSLIPPKPSIPERQQLQVLYDHLKHHRLLQKGLGKEGSVSPAFGEIEGGNKLHMQVVAITSLGVLFINRRHNVIGVAPNEYLEETEKYKVGAIKQVCVLHADLKEKCFIVTTKLQYLEYLYMDEVSKICVGDEAPKISVGMKLKCRVVFAPKDFLLAGTSFLHKGLMVFAIPSPGLEVGRMVRITVLYIEGSLVLGAINKKKQDFDPILPKTSRIDLCGALLNSKMYKGMKISPEKALAKIRNILLSHGMNLIERPLDTQKGDECNEESKEEKNEFAKKTAVQEEDDIKESEVQKSDKREVKKGVKRKNGIIVSSEESNNVKKKKNLLSEVSEGSDKGSKKKKKVVGDSDVTVKKGGETVGGVIDRSDQGSKKKKVVGDSNITVKKEKDSVGGVIDGSDKRSKKKKVVGDSNITVKKEKDSVDGVNESSEKGSNKKKVVVESKVTAKRKKDAADVLSEKSDKGSKKKKVSKVLSELQSLITNESDSGVDENMDADDDDAEVLNKSSKQRLKLNTGFVWNVPEKESVKEEDSSSNEEEEEDESQKKKVKKLTRAERELLAKEEEKRLHELESARLESERLPQTALDYEELLQESPNSSAIWIQFISFHLENAEVDQARTIAKRALQVINVQEFEERINLWTVILRLEVLYGTEESLEEAFTQALATNDSLKIYYAMAMVYAESDKITEAEEIYYKITKKFSREFDVWIKAGIFFFKNKKFEDGRKYMDRALLSLDKTHHVNLINRFAQLEFQFGEVERGRTMFESLLGNYPKRMDMWIVYVDLLTKRGDVEGARQVLERMTSLKLRLRQMRSVFKKFLEFEKIHGTAQSVESVKQRVQDYVAASLQQE